MGIDELNKKIRERSLVISRIPRKTKDEFIALANDEFCGDYGMCLKWCLEQAMEKQAVMSFFENMNFKLNQILGDIPKTEQKPETESIKMVDGRIVKKGVHKT